MYSLLDDPLISVRSKDGDHVLSLPGLLAALSAGKVEGYKELRAHQADPWHVFLVQLAASIQARLPTETLPVDAGYWRDGLLDLADGEAAAWELVVEDVTQPAFMQHPWRSWEEDAQAYGVKTEHGETKYEVKASTPDELDVLVTSKNHDIKMTRVSPNWVEAWIYALMTLQTTSGYLGSGNYGIVRMNSGIGGRPIVSWTESRHPSKRFVSEVRALCGIRDEVVRTHGYQERGVVLTWISRWDRSQHQFLRGDLEPWFCEAARLIRLVWNRDGDGLLALAATTEVRQIGPKTLGNGDVGDPWIPVKIKDNGERSAMTLPDEGLTPALLTDLIFQNGYDMTPIQRPTQGEGDGWFLVSGVALDKGKTPWFHHVEIPVPAKAKMALLGKTSRDTLGHLAERMLGRAKTMQSVLHMALVALIEGGPEMPDTKRVKEWLESSGTTFVRRWGADFFPVLWHGVDNPHNDVLDEWDRRLVGIGMEVFDETAQRMPIPAGRTWRAIAKAQSIWYGMLRKNQFLVDIRSIEGTKA